ncbi:putative analog of CcoH, COG3198 [Sulfuriferula multivorans]|uniref:Putative analog of CcoH, COG3198 n=1 Tax=Sulfuriferula multivorans TaxID=1559896 RepID=A0A401JAM4_9PROT|nr:FixH family protein [Sulfuriferula multivorans]GBL44722.1 putative analog of CcoH, COG3198 [Sulfuriferula multivorans]
MHATDKQPWYREPWPWLLMILPLTAVVAGFITAWYAVVSNDGLVADDYYKEGMAINQTLHRDTAAIALDLGATLHTSADAHTLHVTLAGKLSPLPNMLRLSILHPTQPGHDHVITLNTAGDGSYIGAMPSLGNGRWRLILEPPQREWRLTGVWWQPHTKTLTLDNRHPAKIQTNNLN